MSEAPSEGLFGTSTEAAPIETAPEAEQIETPVEGAPEPKAEAAPKVEETKEAAPETPTDNRVAAKFAALARREKALKAREKQIEERLKALEAAKPKAEAAPEVAPKKPEPSLEYRLKTDPFNTLASLGIGYEKLTEMALNDGKLSPDLQMLTVEEKLRQEFEEKYGSKISAYEKEKQAEAERAEEAKRQEAAAKEQQAITNFKQKISTHIGENKVELELLNVEGEDGADLVYSVMDEHYNATGEILDLKVAAQLVEDQLFEDLQKKLELQKVKSKTGASSATKQGPAKTPSVTLTNNNTQASAPVVKRNLSDDESKEEAAKLIRWIED
jgi:hypothetical protein